MGFRERFRRSRSFGPIDGPLPLLSSLATGSATSFHTALDFQDDLTVSTPTGERRSRQDARQRIRDQLFGPGSDDPNLVRQYSHSPIKLLPVHPDDCLSPTSASPIKRASSNVEELINALREVSKTASPEELEAIRNALGTRQGSEGASSVAKDPAVSSLMRRRTLQKPGVATRTMSHKDLQKPALPESASELCEERTQRQTWSEEMFVNSPLSKLANMQEEKVKVTLGRCETPSEISYPLGAYKIGSLRVMNGAASPQPSVASNRRHTSRDISSSYLRRMDDYFSPTADDAEDSSFAETENGLSHKCSPPIQWEDARVSHQPHLHLETLAPLSGSRTTSTKEVLRPPPSPQGPRHQPAARSATDELSAARPTSSGANSDMARMYDLVATSNPYSGVFSHDELPRVDTDDQNCSAMDPCWDGTQAEYRHIAPTYSCAVKNAANEVPSAFAILGRAVSAKSMAASEASSAYASSSYADSNLSISCATPRPRLVIDSGYGSQSSLKSKASFTTKAEQDPASSALPRDQEASRENDTLKHRSASADDLQSIAHSLVSMKTMLKTSPPYPEPASLPSNAVVMPKLMIHDSSAPSSSIHSPSTSKLSSSSTASSSPTKPEELPKKERKKLQKRRKSIIQQAAPITLRISHDLDNVPAVPSEVASSYSTRMSQNPEMQSLEHTFTSAATSDKCKTADDSSTVELASLRFPSPTLNDTWETSPIAVRGRRSSRRSTGSEAPVRNSFLRSLSRKRRKSRGGDELDDEPSEAEVLQLADFGTVADSLGASPYELATPPSRRRRPSSEVIQHPHQISRRSLSRPKSTGMTEEEASRLALQRSKDRQSRPYASSNKTSPLAAREADCSRPRRPRPKSEVRSEIPPVPALPRPAKSAVRPKSMYGSLEPLSQAASDAWDEVQDNEGWDEYARHWRMRRKSIGEGLLRRPGKETIDGGWPSQRPDSVEQDGSRTSGAATVRPSRTGFDTSCPVTVRSRYYGSKGMSKEEKVGPRPISTHGLSAGRTASPSPSIRERAAMFERASTTRLGGGNEKGEREREKIRQAEVVAGAQSLRNVSAFLRRSSSGSEAMMA